MPDGQDGSGRVSEQDDASVDRFLDGLDDRRDQNERSRAKRAVPTWEYMTWIVDVSDTLSPRVLVVRGGFGPLTNRDPSDVLSNLTRAGEVGWELVSIALNGQRGLAVLKRPKESAISE
jgi:hypothetical protein